MSLHSIGDSTLQRDAGRDLLYLASFLPRDAYA